MDTFVIKDLDVTDLIDGGAGVDRLFVGPFFSGPAASPLDLGSLTNITDIEIIDLGDSAGVVNVVTLTSNDVDAFTGSTPTTGVLTISGEQQDSVQLDGATGAWTHTGQSGDFDEYTASTGQQVLIDQNIGEVSIV